VSTGVDLVSTGVDLDERSGCDRPDSKHHITAYSPLTHLKLNEADKYAERWTTVTQLNCHLILSSNH